MKIVTWTNSDMLNSIVMFKFFLLEQNTFFRQKWTKKKKLPDYNETGT